MFSSLSRLTKNWLKKKGLIQLYQEKEVLNLTNNYFQKIKNYPSQEIKAVSFKKQELFIICKNSSLANEVRLESSNLKEYLQNSLPSIKIKKFNFRLTA